MTAQAERSRNLLINEGAFYRRLRENLANALSPHARKRDSAQEALFSSVRNYPLLNPFLVVTNQLEETFATTPDRRVQAVAGRFLLFFLVKAGPLLHDLMSINLQRTPEIKQAARAMMKRRDDRVPLPRHEDYERFFLTLLPNLCQHPADRSNLEIAITKARNEDDEEQAERLAAWNVWAEELHQAFISKDTEHDLERAVDILKREPPSSPMGNDTYLQRRYASISLADIESLPYPIEQEAYEQITEYLIDALVHTPYNIERGILMRLFFSPQYIPVPEPGRMLNQDDTLPIILNTWQAEFVNRVMFPQSEREEAQTRRVLLAMPEDAARLLVGAVLSWSMRRIHNNPAVIDREHHPLAAALLRQLDQDNPYEGQMFIYIQEVANTYFGSFTVLLLKARLNEFGVLDKFEEWIDVIEQVLVRNPFSKDHLVDIKRVFAQEVGEGFLTQLKEPDPQLEEVAQTAWQQMLEDAGEVPALKGVKTVHSSQDMFSDIIGIKERSMVTIDRPEGRAVSLKFVLRNGFVLIGRLTPQGKLELRAPLEQELPGLYAILQVIAVNTFDDLARQAKADQEEQENRIKSGKRPKLLHERGEQSDQDLIKDVFKRTTPYTYRWVGIHRHRLPYGRRYKDIADAYYAGLATEEEVEATRREAIRFSPSTAKLQNIYKLPTDMQKLEVIIDPLNGVKIATQTWAIGHPSPHPTDEEKKSPQLLFERYYRRGKGSAVAMMEEIKEWLITQAAA